MDPASDGLPAWRLGATVAVAVLAVSTAAPLIRLSEAPSLVIAFWRLALATALLGAAAMAWPATRRELSTLGVRDWAGLSAVGAVLAVHFASWIESLALTSVAASVVLVTIHPVLVGLVSARLYGEGFGPKAWGGVVATLVGGAMIAWQDAKAGPEPLLGDALALVGAVAAAIYFLAGRGYRRRLSLLAYVVPVYGASTVVLLGWTVAAGHRITGYPTEEYALFAALAVVPMVMGHTLLNYALKYVTAPVIATTILGEPVGSTLLALVVLGEVPSVVTVVGGLVVLGGIGAVVMATEAAPGETEAAGT